MRDRNEIAQRIVRKRSVKALVRREIRRGHEERMAVGCGLRHDLGGDVVRPTGAVVDDDRLPEP